MYADLGHFTTIPIRFSFIGFVFPSLILNYMGQAAYILQHPEGFVNPFFFSVPTSVKWPVLVLATIAAIIASQATISGCFTLIDQAISLNVFPNVLSIHTSKSGSAVYIPFFNYLLLVGSTTLVLVFQQSESLANIYGSMTLTSTFYILVMKYNYKLPRWKIGLFIAVFVTLDLCLLASSIQKVSTGGWVSLLLALFLFILMYTWYTTTSEVNDSLRDNLLSLTELRQSVKSITRTTGTIVFVGNADEDVPNVLAISAKMLSSLPMNIVCMSAISSTAPFIADEERTVFRTIDAVAGIYRLVISYGYAERSIDAVTAMERAKKRGLRIKPEERVVFVVGHEIIASGPDSRWWERLRRTIFDTVSRNSLGKVEYFNLPPAQTLELRRTSEIRCTGRKGARTWKMNNAIRRKITSPTPAKACPFSDFWLVFVVPICSREDKMPDDGGGDDDQKKAPGAKLFHSTSITSILQTQAPTRTWPNNFNIHRPQHQDAAASPNSSVLNIEICFPTVLMISSPVGSLNDFRDRSIASSSSSASSGPAASTIVAPGTSASSSRGAHTLMNVTQMLRRAGGGIMQ
ncbi:potassium transporter-domain-containing protein, partial [Blyttiomyces helicus]